LSARRVDEFLVCAGPASASRSEALQPRDYALLEPHLQIVPIREGEFLHLPGDEIEQVYFLHSGIVSLVAISGDGDAIATASVGSEGAIGTIAGTGFVRAFTRAMVQAPGGRLTNCGLALPACREQERGDQ
jgi:CRP-like cAMP-binding protein